MKKLYTLILLIALCCLASCKSAKQSDVAVKAQQADSITLNKGNLLLLIERAYLANKAFKSGLHRYHDIPTDEDMKKRAEADAKRHKEMKKEGYLDWNTQHIEDYYRDERPAGLLFLSQDGKERRLTEDEIKNISPEDVESIEISVNGGKTSLYGGHGMAVGIITVKLKDSETD